MVAQKRSGASDRRRAEAVGVAIFTIIPTERTGRMARLGDAGGAPGRHDGCMRARTIAIAFGTLLCAAGALAGALPKGAPVRIEGIGIESGWHAGRVAINGEGCTMVQFDKATKRGYTMVSLMGTARLERLQSGAWLDQPIKGLRAQEPKACLADGTD
jgi:hypothetical protein